MMEILYKERYITWYVSSTTNYDTLYVKHTGTDGKIEYYDRIDNIIYGVGYIDDFVEAVKYNYTMKMFEIELSSILEDKI